MAKEDDNLQYKTTPMRSETSGPSTSRRKHFDRSSLNPYSVKIELNSTALLPGSIIESMPLYSPPKKTTLIKNPFEQPWLLKEKLSQPVCSPSLFQKHISPISKPNTFSWTVDDISEFRPAPIDENPSQEFTSWYSPDTESQAQEAIDRYFTSMSHGTLESPVVNNQNTRQKSIACQTNLTFPPHLPKALEAELEALCRRCANVLDDSMNSSNCSARRKILPIDFDNYSSSDDDSCSDKNMSVMQHFAATPIRRPMSSPEVSPIPLPRDNDDISPLSSTQQQDCHMSVCASTSNAESPSR